MSKRDISSIGLLGGASTPMYGEILYT